MITLSSTIYSQRETLLICMEYKVHMVSIVCCSATLFIKVMSRMLTLSYCME